LKKPILLAALLVVSMALASIVAVRTVKAQSTVIAMDPALIDNILPGQSFLVNVRVDISTHQLFMWVLSLQWNPSIVNMTVDPVEGPFLKSLGPTAFIWSELSRTEGYVRELTCSSLTAMTGTGSGVIVTFNFTGLNPPTSALDLRGPTLDDPNPIWLDIEGTQSSFGVVTDGSVIVVSEFPTFLVAPLFIIMTLVTVILTKTAWLRKRRDHLYVQ